MVRQITLCLLLLLYSPGRAQISAWFDSSAAQLHDIVDETTISNAAYWSTHGFNQIRDIIGMIDTTWAIASNYANINGAITSLPTASDAGVVLIPYTFADGQSYTKSDSSLILDYRIGNLLRLDGNMAFSGAVNIGVLTVPTSAIPLYVLTTTDISPQWIFEAQGTGVFGGTLKLRHNSATPATNDALGALEWSGNDNMGNNAVFGFVNMLAKNVTDGSEAGEFAWLLQNAGTLDTVFVMRSAPNKEVVFNPDSLDYDFRVHANGSGNAFFVEGSTGRVGLNEPAPETPFHMTASSVLQPQFLMENTTNDQNTGAIILMRKNRTSPADGDNLGAIIHQGNDLGGSNNSFVTELTEAERVTVGEESGSKTIILLMSDDERSFLKLNAYNGTDNQGEIIFNEDGQDIDFRIESSSDANAFIILGLTGDIGMGISPDTNVDLHIYDTVTSNPVLTLESDQDGTPGATLQFILDNDGGEADDDILGNMFFIGDNSDNNPILFSKIFGQSEDITSGDDAGSVIISVMMDSTLREMVRFSGYNGSVNQGEIVFNEDSQDVDFRVESDNNATSLVVVGNVSGEVGIGTTPDSGVNLHVKDAGSSVVITLESEGDFSTGPTLQLVFDDSSPDDGEVIALISTISDDSGGTPFQATQILSIIDDVTNGTEDTSVELRRVVNANLVPYFVQKQVTTTDGNDATIYTLATISDNNYMIEVHLAGTQDDGTNEYYAEGHFAISNLGDTVTEDTGGTLTFEDDNGAGSPALLGAVSSTNYLIQVNGVTSETWKWSATIWITQVAH